MLSMCVDSGEKSFIGGLNNVEVCLHYYQATSSCISSKVCFPIMLNTNKCILLSPNSVQSDYEAFDLLTNIWYTHYLSSIKSLSNQ